VYWRDYGTIVAPQISSTFPFSNLGRLVGSGGPDLEALRMLRCSTVLKRLGLLAIYAVAQNAGDGGKCVVRGAITPRTIWSSRPNVNK
jgi:hypothetical protein